MKFSIEIIVDIEGMSGNHPSAAAFVTESIRGKVKKYLDGESFVKKWEICKPNELNNENTI